MKNIQYIGKMAGLVLVFCFLPFSLHAWDWGLLTTHTVTQGGTGKSANDIKYQGSLVPWLSAPVTDNGDLYISGSFSALLESGTWALAPELFQTDFAWNFGNGEIRLGRMGYSDPLGFIMAGFFDGVSMSLDTSGGGTFSAGAWYTGLQYKKTANITMTTADLNSYYENLSYTKFADTYFASKRLAFALGWEHPGIKELVRLNVSLQGQFDLNGRDSRYNSQYLAARAVMPLGNYFVFDLGGTVEIAEEAAKPDASSTVSPGLAGELAVSAFLPGTLQNRLKFSGIFSSGKSGGIAPFVPVTTVSQGAVLQAK
ncbi:MAG: hypothetical protein FWF29_10370, partial [Treponema sp.]|nr:hypothetical protein [Treponema sp.]